MMFFCICASSCMRKVIPHTCHQYELEVVSHPKRLTLFFHICCFSRFAGNLYNFTPSPVLLLHPTAEQHSITLPLTADRSGDSRLM